MYGRLLYFDKCIGVSVFLTLRALPIFAFSFVVLMRKTHVHLGQNMTMFGSATSYRMGNYLLIILKMVSLEVRRWITLNENVVYKYINGILMR